MCLSSCPDGSIRGIVLGPAVPEILPNSVLVASGLSVSSRQVVVQDRPALKTAGYAR